MHESVLLKECIDNLNLCSDYIVVDCTLGRAGHSSEILKRIPNGFLYAFDQDEEAIESSYKRLKEIGDNFKIINSNFVNIKEELNKLGIKKVNAIIYDLGVSSPQLDEAERGFSFHKDSRLDMRMNQKQDLDAHYVVNEYSLEDLIKIFKTYGEEKYAVSIAKGIIKNRPINTTLELTEIIKENVPFSYKKDHHPSRKVFQAIRIEVNDELNVFEKSLKDALDLIDINGRIEVITFHSLEDKICKNIFKKVSSVDENLKNLPIIPIEYQPDFQLVASIEPSENELENNNRSRSARLRIIERKK
ncbi:MAG: 16S rRNA (cytosine(1402)-N(4))-methyltransferase RsmH [Firmicutes bacterium]|nr:16S rRNA (cytosine(1402)-N(4))-methyltransferase RsmH [Bacillota bacterium]